MKDRLKEYIEKDEIYQEYKNGKLTNTSDFDNFCIQHCEDIEELLEERKEWIKLLNMFKKQQQEFIKYLEQCIENEKYCYLAERQEDRVRKDIFEEILQKYKKIIVVSND